LVFDYQQGKDDETCIGCNVLYNIPSGKQT